MATTCLSFHASYRCRHAGACCDAAWDIEVDPPIVAAVSVGRFRPVSVAATPFERLRDETGRPFVAPARVAGGTCGFRTGARCSLQLAGGESMLPTACRHFPRVYRREPHGDRLTLSHFCPTAALLLFTGSPVAITEADPPLALDGATQGLDVRNALPPLLRPGMLTDHAGYDAWEESVVQAFACGPSPQAAFERIIAATERIRRWRPADGALEAVVRREFTGGAPRIDAERLSRGFDVIRQAIGEHPLLALPADLPGTWRRVRALDPALVEGPLQRYLAACAFANWVAYRGQGLRSIVEWLRGCYDVFRVQVSRAFEEEGSLRHDSVLRAFRDSDYLMVHTVDSLAFGRAIAAVE